jgi:hypothetical protein
MTGPGSTRPKVHWFRDALRESPKAGVAAVLIIPVAVIVLAVAGVVPAEAAPAAAAAVLGCGYGIRHNRLRR